MPNIKPQQQRKPRTIHASVLVALIGMCLLLAVFLADVPKYSVFAFGMVPLAIVMAIGILWEISRDRDDSAQNGTTTQSDGGGGYGMIVLYGGDGGGGESDNGGDGGHHCGGDSGDGGGDGGGGDGGGGD